MSLFNNNKDTVEQKQTSEIKNAAISDTQIDHVNVSPVNNQPEDFVNPFAQPGNTTQSPIQTNQNTDSNPLNSSMPMNSQPIQNTQVLPQENFNFSNLAANNVETPAGVDFDQIQEMIDETVEKIIEEKWNTLEDKINKVLRWKDNKDAEINMLKEDIVTISEHFNKLEMKLINKISNYDKNILDVNSEIKALEKVFQKITPTLINNVNELSRIADDLKGIKPQDEKTEDNKQNSDVFITKSDEN